MLVAVFGDAHAHADAFEAVVRAAETSGAAQLWSLGDMVGAGARPCPCARARCTAFSA